MKILAVDPGGTTGFAMLLSDGSHQAWEVEGEIAACEEIMTYIKHGADALVCESFTISAATAKKTQAGSLQAIELIGVARWLAYCHGVNFVLQAPADAAKFVTPQMLHAMSWWTKGSDHARSASKHLLLYCVRNKIVDPARLIT